MPVQIHINQLITGLILIMGAASCKNQPPAAAYQKIETGQGGGITGHYRGYTLLENRYLYHWEQPSEEERIILDSSLVDSQTVTGLFLKMNGLENKIPGMVKPGSMGTYVQYFKGDSAIGYWIWGADGLPPGPALSEFWTEFHKEIKKSRPVPLTPENPSRKNKKRKQSETK